MRNRYRQVILGYTGRVKTAVSIPDALFEAADRAAQRLGVSRSELYARALERFLGDDPDDVITARLDELYATESSTLDPALADAQQRAIADIC
jgi:metal-responsive CopG/Arc/MetJ family transcriptional regulator